MKVCDHCDLNQGVKAACSVCGRQTRNWTAEDSRLAIMLLESRQNRQYGLQGKAVTLGKSSVVVRTPTRRLGNPIRLAGQNGKRLRIKSGPQDRQKKKQA